MSIVFTCPHCQKKATAPDRAAGRRATCPKCRQRLLVPSIQPQHDFLPVAQGISPPPVRRPSMAPGTKLLLWAGGFVVVCAGGFATGIMLRAMKNETPEAASGAKYPSPVSKFNGRTAAQWGKEALDMEHMTCFNAGYALNQLGAEGVPFLLNAVARQRSIDEKGTCLSWLKGSLIDPDDFPIVAACLNDQYANRDDFTPSLRRLALVVIREGGERAIKVEPEVRRLVDHPKLGEQARAALKAMGAG